MTRNFRELPLYRFLQSLDYLQVGTVAMLLCIGLIFIHSTGTQIDTPESLASFGKQLRWIGIGTAVYLLVAALDYRSFSCRVAMLFGYAVSLVLLVVVLFFGLKIFGATRWLNFFGLRLQPSEPAKLMVIGVLSAIFSAPKFSSSKSLCILMSSAAVGIPFFLIAIEPDLGSSLVLLPVAGIMLFSFGIKWRYVLLGLTAIAVGISFVLLDSFREDPILLRDYQRDRIKVFLNPGSDLSNRGHNAHQALLAVGSGGLSGTGIGRGIQNELGFLPQTVSNNDFIFSVIAEETGFVGVLFLLTLYLVLLYTILRTAFIVSGYGRYIAVGVAMLIFCHIFINIGMSIGIAPVTGLPLPLVSYGGSFILTTMTTLGLVQSIYRHAKLEMLD